MPRRPLHLVVLWLLLFGFWIVFSGKFDAVHLIMGAVCAALVCGLSADQLYSEVPGGGRLWLTLIHWPRLLAYFPWLGWEIVKANIQVLKLVFGPISRLQPSVFRFQSRLGSEVARVFYGNSITLTPGTVTLDVDRDGVFEVHALDRSAEKDFAEGLMERRVGAVFGEGPGR